MADCYLKTFDPLADPTYVLTKSDRLIMLRSDETHSEFQFSSRYGRVSASATMADECRCFRFKKIDYEKHPLRWHTDIVKLTDEQEDRIMFAALHMAGLIRPINLDKYPNLGHLALDQYAVTFNGAYNAQIWFGSKALKYDLAGVSISFIIPKWRIWRPHERWVWCSESITILLKVAFTGFKCRADEQTPSTLRANWRKFKDAA